MVGLAFSPDSQILAAGSWAEMRLWRVSDGAIETNHAGIDQGPHLGAAIDQRRETTLHHLFFARARSDVGCPARVARRERQRQKGAAAVTRGGPVKRTKDVRVRLTPDEHALWEAARERSGRKELGAWVRATITDGVVRYADGLS